jgi:enolase
LKIAKVHGREVLDSRGLPTVEAEVFLSNGTSASAMVPAGASTGKNEAHELRDDFAPRWMGRGATSATAKINKQIDDVLRGAEADIFAVDDLLLRLDGTNDKSKLGANAILAVSLANARASAMSREIPLYEMLRQASGTKNLSLPTPMVNIISGGLHADGNFEMQDFLVIPIGASSFREALDWIGSIYHTTKKLLAQRGFSTLLADEGGFGPRLKHQEDALEILLRAVEVSSLTAGRDVALAVDAAASRFFRRGRYELTSEEASLDSVGMVDLFEKWVREYPIVSIEDGCSEDDWTGWVELTSRLGSRIQRLGDDIFTTNPALIAKGKERGAANAVLIKPNQIGTLSETLRSIQLCREIGYAPVISARSGDTEDTFIADLAVGTSAGQIKIGSIGRSERTAKYNQLLRLEELLGEEAVYSGSRPFGRTSEIGKER